MLSREVDKDSSDLYLVYSSNWESVVEGGDPQEAATLALEDRMKKTGLKTEISTVIMALNLTAAMRDFSVEPNLHILYAPKILANAGLHESSKNLQCFIDDLKSNE